MRDAVLQERARAMRRDQTPAERAVWRVLRAPPFDALHFRRQVTFGNRYVADFASHRTKIIVEVDGPTHDGTVEADTARTAWFATQGYRVVRLTNTDVRENYDVSRLLAHLVGVA